jgi:hypothetical protein
MKRPHYNGYVMDYSTYPFRQLPANLACAESGPCVCGFCKGVGMCEWGDCHNMLPKVGAGTLCLNCSAKGYGSFPGHRASVVELEAAK